MMVFDERPYVALWLLFWGYWMIAARRSREQTTESTESPSSRMAHLCLMAVAFLLVSRSGESLGPLCTRLWPAQVGIYWIGIFLTGLGLTFAIWARVHLGRFWSGGVAIKTQHRLIKTGPYGHLRHPIYAGVVFALLGTAIGLGEVRGLLSVAVLLTAYVRKIRLEETFLVQQFGAEFTEYAREVPALIPFVF